MKKFALMTLGLMLGASACFADATVTVKNIDAAYLQKYVMDDFYYNNDFYTFESRTAEKFVYYTKKPIQKRDTVVGHVREEVIFTTVQQGDDVVLGLEKNKIETFKDGKVNKTKNGNDLEDRVLLNKYRSFCNDSYSFGFTADRKTTKEGVAILSVYGNGPMHDAGIQNGSIITAVNGQSIAEHAAEFQNGLIPDKFSGEPVTFKVKFKGVEKSYTLTPVLQECKYTKIQQARAKAEKDRVEGRRGIESWLKL